VIGAKPLATVVIPARNAAGEIARCVTAALAQDLSRDAFRVVAVDNGSHDGTAEEAARAGAEVVHEDRLASSYAARNRGIEAATGEWVAFTDSDCVPEPTWLRLLLAPPIPDEVGAVVGEIVALEAETPVQRLTERHGIMRHAVTLPHKDLPCFSTANVAIRRSLLRELGGFREDVRYFGDMELSWRMQLERNARLLFRPEARILHRHRRTWGALWRQGVQHGRGVAFMRRTFPGRYRFSAGEQVSRLGTLARAASGRGGSGDRLWDPLWLTLWYGGLLAGYLRGPAWTPDAKRRT
jgi:cellulose synthase/poly-beta-1,6-N-acetylglucosamine synthase-like glycosyltransferase